jgi:transcriptional regulator
MEPAYALDTKSAMAIGPAIFSVLVLARSPAWNEASDMNGAEISTFATPSAGSAEPLSPFERFGDADVRALVEEYPLAWVSAKGGTGIEASLLPLIGVYDAQDRLIELIGHLARANPLCAALSREPEATLLFRGPEGYVSPQQAGRGDWAPTWNYAQLRMRATVAFDDAWTEPALNVLIAAMEKDRTQPWSQAELGPRYQSMLGAIIGFRARPVEVAGKFKLGQDERPATLRAILAATPDEAMQRWMRRFNAGRI